MRLLKFNEAYKDRPMTEEDLEVVEDCLYGLIETWDLKTKYIPKENPTPYSTTQIREYGFEDDNRFTGDYYMSLDNRHMGSINLSIRMSHLKGGDLKKFLNGLNIFYRRLESQGMSECSGKNTGKRSWTVREWDIHIRWSPYKKWKESELQNIKPFNESDNININGLQDIKDEILFDVLDNFPLHKECIEPGNSLYGTDILNSDFEDYGQILWSICQNADYTNDFKKRSSTFLPNQYVIFVRYIWAPRATKDLGFVDMLSKKVKHWNNIGWDAKMTIKSDKLNKNADQDNPHSYNGFEEDFDEDQTSTWSENLNEWVNVNLITITLDKTKKSA